MMNIAAFGVMFLPVLFLIAVFLGGIRQELRKISVTLSNTEN